MSTTINGTSGVTFPDGTNQTTSPFAGGLGFRNRIINGDFRIDQRNAGASVTLTSGGAQVYAVDRFYGYYDTSATSVTNQQVTDVPTGSGFINSYKWTTGTGGSATAAQQVRIIHRIEGLNVADLMWGTANAKTITISFWVKSSLTGTFSCAVQNSAVDRSYVATYSISSTNTWEQKSITISGDTTGTWLTTNGVGIGISFDLGSGSNRQTTANTWTAGNYHSQSSQPTVIGNSGATFYITGVQLEKGSTATSFDYRPYGTELALCQRYYFRRTSASTFDRIATLQTYSSNGAFGKMFDFPVPMRASPTANKSATGDTGLYNASGSILNAVTTQGALRTSQFGCHTDGDISTGLTSGVTGGATTLAFNTTSGWYDFSAEL